MSGLKVLQGGRGGQEQFVCPWCGANFTRRNITSDGEMSLEEHWRASAVCGNNRNVNSPLQDKYKDGSEE